MRKSNFKAFKEYVLSFFCLLQLPLTLIQIFFPALDLFSEDKMFFFRAIMSGLSFLIVFPIILHRSLIRALKIYLVLIFFCIVSVFINASNVKYISEGGVLLFFTSIPIYLSAISIKSKYIFERVLNWLSGSMFVLAICYFYFFYKGKILSEFSYNMSLGYSLLLPSLYFIRKGGVYDIFKGLLLCFLMIFVGSRGPVIVFLIYFGFILFTKEQSKRYRFITLFTYIILLTITLLSVYYYMKTLDLSSRTIDLFLEGEALTHDSGRTKIYSNLLDKLNLSPILGMGIFGDRYYLGGSYVHNIFLEILCHFGYVLGSGIIFYLFCLIIRKYKTSNTKNKSFYFMFLCNGFLPLLVSSSYLINFNFALFLGIILNKFININSHEL